MKVESLLYNKGIFFKEEENVQRLQCQKKRGKLKSSDDDRRITRAKNIDYSVQFVCQADQFMSSLNRTFGMYILRANIAIFIRPYRLIFIRGLT